MHLVAIFPELWGSAICCKREYSQHPGAESWELENKNKKVLIYPAISYSAPGLFQYINQQNTFFKLKLVEYGFVIKIEYIFKFNFSERW